MSHGRTVAHTASEKCTTSRRPSASCQAFHKHTKQVTVVSHLLARTPYSFVQEFNAESEVCVDELVHRIGFEKILSFPSAMRERVMAVTGVTFALWTRRTSGTLDAYSTRTCGKLIQVVKISKEENMSVKLDTVLLK